MSDLEDSFSSEIDCRFPYGSEAGWMALIERGVMISPNAAFMVLEEICRPPRSVTVGPDELKRMVAHWRQRFEHPVAGIVLEAAVAMINGEDLTVEEAISHMERIAPYRNLYAALGILYMSCDDINGKADAVYEAIIKNWKAA